MKKRIVFLNSSQLDDQIDGANYSIDSTELSE